ncbi:MAG: MBL fold metallo-hydrolase [Oscillospiraceae bacterium]|nr:MBL fold metallo-hydrolase [Oscillospiraceae bacterium]
MDDHSLHGFLIDPGAEAGRLLDLIQREGWTIEKILLTHGHFDHTGAVSQLREMLDIPVLAHENADRYLLDPKMNLSAFCVGNWIVKDVDCLKDGDRAALSGNPAFALKTIYTPGHTTDSVIYYSERDGIAFVGDTIFKGSIGEYRYPGGDRNTLLKSIRERIFTLPENTVLYSGHSGETTVKAEMRRYSTISTL